jgi:hypothetical protein
MVPNESLSRIFHIKKSGKVNEGPNHMFVVVVPKLFLVRNLFAVSDV